MNENIFNKLFKQGVLGLCAFDVLDLPIAEKVKIALSLTVHIVPLAPAVSVYTVPESGVKNSLRNYQFSPFVESDTKPVESDME